MKMNKKPRLVRGFFINQLRKIMRQLSLCINKTGTPITDGHRIIEIGIIELENRKLTGKYFHSYFNPYREILVDEIADHGLTPEFLDDKPSFYEFAERINAFIGEDEILTENIESLIFLRHEFSLCRTAPLSEYIRSPTEKNCLSHSLTQEEQKEFTNAKSIFSSESKNLIGALLDAEIQADSYLTATSNEVIAQSFSEFHHFISELQPKDLCRGIPNRAYKLLPSLFRHPENQDPSFTEKNMMWLFRTQAQPHLERVPNSPIQWLTIAQHHGLPTRLLDWSLSPLVACFFAVQSEPEKNAAVYIYSPTGFHREEDINPENLKATVAFLPSHGTKRITAQSGVFTIHPDLSPELESASMKKIIIPKYRKKEFLKTLSKYGINNSTLFPDLDGLTSHIKYIQNYR